ncbi:MAG: M64 family metallopeptidase [Bacteroidales bacterium]
MKIISLIFLFITFINFNSFAEFDNLFHLKTLRLDYIHAGDSVNEFYYFDEIKIEPYWGGSLVNLVDTFHYGKYYMKVFDVESGLLIYSKGYSTLFGEWQTTDEAKKTNRAFTESVICPLPKYKSKIVLLSRNTRGKFEEKFEYIYEPDDYFISTERRLTYPFFDALISGNNHTCVDIVILPDGYTEAEMGKFISDCNEFAEVLFAFEPYIKYKDKFNIRGILAPSPESGNDIPADSVWKKTLLNTSFYTFDSERYCMTYDYKSVRDLAANAPYDQIYILVNTARYGGGAIYNYYSVSVNSNKNAAKIFIHELGHGFAGLGDEYYNSAEPYSDFYPVDIEAWEPNLTTLVNFESKWPHLLSDKTPVPTPDKKKYFDQTGVFEGGGYASKGVYRPATDCLMNTFKKDNFCKVCSEAIEEMILFYTK